MGCVHCGVGGGVGTRSRMCHGGWGEITWGKCCYVYMRIVVVSLWYSTMCVCGAFMYTIYVSYMYVLSSYIHKSIW